MLRNKLCLWVLMGALVLSTGNAFAELIAYYPFDEGQSTATVDATGNGNDGTLSGGVEWVDGYKGMAVHFDTAGERVVLNDIDPSKENDAMTLAAWINWEGNGHSITHQGIFGKRQGWDPKDGIKWFWEATPAGQLALRNGDEAVNAPGVLTPYENEWAHVALTWSAGAVVQYVNAEEVGTGTQTFRDTADATIVSIGCVSATNTETFVGSIDEARIYNVALDAAGIAKAMTGDSTPATVVAPGNTATDVRRDVTLNWNPGDFAVSHDVYLGTDMAVVQNASRTSASGVLVSQGQTDTSYQVDTLLPIGTMHYWRIDEVNAPPDSTVFKGDVWSFTVEPKSYPVPAVTATASAANLNMGPENTVDGSGLNADGGHSTSAEDMWLAPSLPAWIQFEFDGVYVLDEMTVWNSNQAIESFLGFGAKEVAIEVSTDGETWAPIEGETILNQATAMVDYRANTVVDMGTAPARYVRLNINSAHGMIGQVGLSEVSFTYIPVFARAPQPASGVENAALDTQLDWRMGRLAAAHEVLFGNSTDALILADTVERAGFDPGILEFGTDYFWQINEVNEAEVPAVYAGPIWKFTTKQFETVEGFETFSADEGQEVFLTWWDGFGGDPALGGSTAGHIDAPFVETTLTSSGKNSLPIYYDNDGGFVDIDGQTTAPRFSEVERDLGSMDLTANGADTLSIAFLGNAGGFTEDADGNITMSAQGNDIWNNEDQFRFAYKILSGNGSITAKINSALDQNEWTKVGVMIRETANADSVNSFSFVTPQGRVGTQWRELSSGITVSTRSENNGDITLPFWVRVTRTGNTFKGERSPDGVTWSPMIRQDIPTDPGARDINMGANVLIGVAATSHSAGVTTIAQISDVSFTGNVSGAWQAEAVGVEMPANGADPVYVILKDNSGKTGIVTHPDPAATQLTDWQDWQIPLADFGSLRFNRIDAITIGVGHKDGSQAGGEGILYVDDIKMGRPFQAMGLVAHYPLEDGAKDVSGNGFDGAVMGEPAVIDGPVDMGMALEFDGTSSQYVDLGTFNPTCATGQLTVALWAKWNGLSGQWQGLIGKRNAWNSTDTMWQIEAHRDTGTLSLAQNAGGFADGDPVLPIGEWAHVAGICDGTTGKLYLNGVVTGEGSFNLGPAVGASLVFGCCQTNGGNPFNGALDEIYIYDRALSDAEIQDLAGVSP
jgi:hypothetical protein